MMVGPTPPQVVDASWLVLATGQTAPARGDAPAGYYVLGQVTDGVFVPESDVLGSGPVNVAGHPGWMELASGHFFGAETARAPIAPYVRGAMTKDGFVPSSPHIVRY